MSSPRVERGGRGWVRGLFLSVLLVVFSGCDKTAPAAPADVSSTDPTAGDSGPSGLVDAAASEDLPPAPPPPPQELAAPWTELAPSFQELSSQVGDAAVGKLSGEAWGKERPVRAIVRAQCGSGALLQAVFENDKGELLVTPAMPVRFVGLATGKPVTYSEGAFDVEVNFSKDTPDRLTGHLKITYEEQGQDKTFIDMEVDGKPLPMLLEPRLDAEARLPEFQGCHPSGRFYVRTADGRQARGYLYASIAPNNRAIAVNLLLSPQTGLRIVVLTRQPLDKPWTLDLSKDPGTAPVRIDVTAFYTPQLTDPDTAEGPNIGSEQTVSVRRGQVTVDWKEMNKRASAKLRFENLEIPELIEGPLRGTTLEELVIDADAHLPSVYPPPPPAEPLGPGAPPEE